MLLALLPALAGRGCTVALACLGPAQGPGAEVGRAAARLGLPVRYAGMGGRLSPGGLLRLAGLIRALHPRLLHVHGYKATVLAVPAARLLRVPAVATFHTHARHDIHAPRGVVAVEGKILRTLPGVAAVSQPVRRELEDRGVRPERIRVIPNGIEVEPDRLASSPGAPLPGGRPALAVVGRLIERKNVQVLLRAVARLREAHPELTVLLAGEGPYRAELERLAGDLDLGHAVRFLGFVEDVRPLLRASDLFVLPSATEGMPISVLEAMACGTPIVATRVGSIPDVARDGREALLVEPGSVDALADALGHALADAALRARLAASARERLLAEYTAERMAERYVEFYEWVEGGTAGRGQDGRTAGR
jgi:glycosyltransferase involved in cell wall biosynthesis